MTTETSTTALTFLPNFNLSKYSMSLKFMDIVFCCRLCCAFNMSVCSVLLSVCVCMSTLLCLSFYPSGSFYQCVCIYIYLYLYVCDTVCISTVSVCVCLLTSLSVDLPISPYVPLGPFISVCLCPSTCLCTCLSLSFCVPVCLSSYLSVSRSLT